MLTDSSSIAKAHKHSSPPLSAKPREDVLQDVKKCKGVFVFTQNCIKLSLDLHIQIFCRRKYKNRTAQGKRVAGYWRRKAEDECEERGHAEGGC